MPPSRRSWCRPQACASTHRRSRAWSCTTAWPTWTRFDASTPSTPEAFGGRTPPDDPRYSAQLERRRRNQIAAGNRRVVLATIDGEPAGSSGLSLYPPDGAIINGGGVRPKFRGRGIYRTMVAARLEMACEAAVAGLSVWGAPMSAPILARLGFETVGWRRFYRAP